MMLSEKLASRTKDNLSVIDRRFVNLRMNLSVSMVRLMKSCQWFETVESHMNEEKQGIVDEESFQQL